MLLLKKFSPFLLTIVLFGCLSKEVNVITATFKDGQPKIEETFLVSGSDSIPISQIEYHENGAIKMTGPLDSAGLRHGEWNAFYADSSKWSFGTYEHGVAQGNRKVWFPNSQLRIEGQYEDGKEVGLWKYRNEQGKVIHVEDFSQR